MKDERVRQRITRTTVLYRLTVRLIWFFVLLPLTLPGLTLWAPVFMTAAHQSNKIKKSGSVTLVYDEIAQYKLVYGFFSGLLIYLTCLAFTWPYIRLTAILVPMWMWMTLRWFEDLVSTFRASKALWRLFLMPRATLHEMQARRDDLHERVHAFALTLGLPEDPERFFAIDPGQRTEWDSNSSKRASADKNKDVVDAQQWFMPRGNRSQKGQIRSEWDAIMG